jgi:hypothetical protein
MPTITPGLQHPNWQQNFHYSASGKPSAVHSWVISRNEKAEANRRASVEAIYNGGCRLLAKYQTAATPDDAS